jgi:hypothetical protein
MISFIENKLQDIAVRVKQHTQWEELLGKKFLTTKALFGIRQLKKAHTQFLETRSPPNGSVSCPISKKKTDAQFLRNQETGPTQLMPMFVSHNSLSTPNLRNHN